MTSSPIDPLATLPELYKRWRKPLRAWLARRVSLSGVDPDDVVQDVFVRLLRYPDVQANVQYINAYIFTIASNVVADYRELCVNRRPHDPVDSLDNDELTLDELTISDSACPEYIAQSESVGREVRQIVCGMPIRMQQCLWMHVHHELTRKQIASRLGLTEHQVNHDLVDAYEKLRRILP